MTIAFIKRFTCDNCGKQTLYWGDAWQSKLVLHPARGCRVAYDETLIACSDTCAKELDEKRTKPRLIRQVTKA